MHKIVPYLLMSRKYRWGILGALLLLSFVFCCLTLDPYHAWGGDFALYLLQTEALVGGNSYDLLQENAFSMDHSEIVLGPHLYPPGFPLLLLPYYLISGLDLYPLKFVGLVCYLLFQVVLIRYFLEEISQNSLILLVALFSLNPWLIRYCDFIISDLPFLLFSTLTLYFIRCFYKGTISTIGWVYLGTSMAMAYLIRTVGIVLLGTLLVIWILIIFRRKTPSMGNPKLLLGLTIFFLIIGLAELLYPSGHVSYLSYLYPYDPQILLKNISSYFLLPTLHLGKFGWLAYVLILPVSTYGMIRYASQYLPELVFMSIYLTTLLIWPFMDGLRFVFPLLPFVLLFWVLGLEEIFKKLWGKKHLLAFQKFVLPVAFLTLLSGCILNARRDFPADPIGKVNNKESQQLFQFIREHSSKETQIAFFRPRILRLFTARSAIALKSPPLEPDSPLDLWIQPTFEDPITIPTHFRLIFSNREFEVYEVKASE